MDKLAQINTYIENHRNEIINFARELVAIKSMTGKESQVALAIKKKMESLHYDEVIIDTLGNVIGKIGFGNPDILFDSHMDTVTVTDSAEWAFNPYGGEVIDNFVCGRGAVDMKCGLAAAVYAGGALKAIGLAYGNTIGVSATVMEEDYDGAALYQLCCDPKHTPKHVVICEPSSLQLALGHRGRALIEVETTGVAAHGSSPEKGVNAIYAMQPVIQRIEELSNTFIHSEKHKGSITLSIIESTAVSANAVPSSCRIFIDRRLSLEENKTYIENEMGSLLQGIQASWRISQIKGNSWTGEPLVLDSFLPAWEISSKDPFSLLAQKTYSQLFQEDPKPFFWNFCTNGVASSGKLNIPTIGFGPGNPELAHKRDEKCSIYEMLRATEFYALLGTSKACGAQPYLQYRQRDAQVLRGKSCKQAERDSELAMSKPGLLDKT